LREIDLRQNCTTNGAKNLQASLRHYGEHFLKFFGGLLIWFYSKSDSRKPYGNQKITW
jgi:hypothetical protein